MIGLVLVTHGRLAGEFVAAMEHVVGPKERVEAVCIGPDDDMEARRADISAAADRVDSGKGVILINEMLGGTRKEEGSVGKGCVRTCRYWWLPQTTKKKQT